MNININKIFKMPRKILPQEEKKKKISISLNKQTIDLVDKKYKNRSKYIENLIKKDIE